MIKEWILKKKLLHAGNKSFAAPSATFRGEKYVWMGDNAEIGKKARVIVHSPERDSPNRERLELVHIGDNTIVSERCQLNVISLDNALPENACIHLGDRVLLMESIIINSALGISIGDDTILGANSLFQDHNHSFENVGVPIRDQGVKPVAPISIGSGCWGGVNCVYLGGTSIGDGCVIGANSVIKGTFPSYCVIAGAPARIVKRYNEQTRKWEKPAHP